jgi:MHS family proline/betaine transporter-like MFS transporter
MLGSLVATIAHNSLSPADLEDWGWRIPFIVGVAIGAVGLLMRTSLSETPEFEKLKCSGQISENPFAEVLHTMPWRIFHLAALVVIAGGGFYLLFVWWPTFLSEFLVPPIPDALLLNTISMVLLMVLIPVSGSVSDKVGRRAMHIFGSAGVAISACPLFMLAGHATWATALVAQLIFTVLISIFMGPVPATMVELFPPGTRYMGTALGYNISLCIFGGTAPLVGTWLVASTGSIYAPACYLMAMAVISLVASVSLDKSYVANSY